ncbi:MAG: hypothetical protein AAF620_16760 [Bacteroidota bacterium]
MTESNHRKWDIRLKIFGPILTVVGLIITVIIFIVGESNIKEREIRAQEQQDALEFKRKFWEKQMDSYQKTARVAGNIAASLQSERKIDSLIHEFYILYHGQMILFEDEDVISAMKNMHREIKAYQDGTSSSIGGLKPEERVVRASNFLNDKLKISSEKTWVTLNILEKTTIR